MLKSNPEPFRGQNERLRCFCTSIALGEAVPPKLTDVLQLRIGRWTPDVGR